jgi:hypothetical protein
MAHERGHSGGLVRASLDPFAVLYGALGVLPAPSLRFLPGKQVCGCQRARACAPRSGQGCLGAKTIRARLPLPDE